MSQNLRSLVAYALGLRDGLAGFVQRLPGLSGIPSSESRHWSVCSTNSCKTVAMCEPDTVLEVTAGAQHVAAGVFGIAKPAERLGLALGRARFASQLKTAAVLAQAALNVTARKPQNCRAGI